MAKGRVSTRSVFTGKAANGVTYTIRFPNDQQGVWAAYEPTASEVATIKAASASLTTLRKFLGIANLKEVKTQREPVLA